MSSKLKKIVGVSKIIPDGGGGIIFGGQPRAEIGEKRGWQGGHRLFPEPNKGGGNN